MTLFTSIIFVPILVLILLTLNLLLAPSEVDSEKISSYESGFEPVGTARSQFSISYYLVAILFLIFDLELALFYPLATSLNLVSIYGFLVGLMFFGALTLGFVFEYGSGVISFKTEKKTNALILLILLFNNNYISIIPSPTSYWYSSSSSSYSSSYSSSSSSSEGLGNND